MAPASNLILHIGLHRTGTKFLQKTIFAHLHEVEDHILYNPPELLNALNQQYSVIAAGSAPGGAEKASLRALVQKTIAAANSARKTVLLSNESISQSMAFQNYAQHWELFREIFPPVTIIVTFRYQPDWIESSYRHLVASGLPIRKENITNLLGAKDRDCLFNIEKVNYSDLIDKYNSYCGLENVHALFFEDMLQKTDYFESRLKFALGVKKFPPIDYSLRRNTSMSAAWISLLVRLGKIANVRVKREAFLRQANITHRIYHRTLRALASFGVEHMRDWSILAETGVREKLDDIFREQNIGLSQKLGGLAIPSRYLRPVESSIDASSSTKGRSLPS